MAFLSSSSTLAQVQAAYDDNASYDLESDEAAGLVKAAKFIEACRILIRRRPMTTSADGALVTLVSLRNDMDAAVAWRTARDADARIGPSTTRCDLRQFRRNG